MNAELLASPEAFQDWLSNSNQSTQAILESIPDSNELGRCRIMCVASWLMHPPATQRLANIRRCLNAKDRRVAAYALAYKVAWQMIDEYALVAESHHFETAEFLPMLKEKLAYLEGDSSSFAFEAKAVLLWCIATLELLDESYDAALASAAEALLWAKEVNAKVVIGQVKGLLISIHLAKGNLEDVIHLSTSNNEKHVPLVDRLYQQIFTALALAQLGSWERAAAQLNALAKYYPLSEQYRDASLSIHAAHQQVLLFAGVGGLEGEIIKDHHPTEWLVRGIRSIQAARALPRLSHKHLNQRSNLFQQAIRELEARLDVNDAQLEAYGTWAAAYAAKQQGKTALALSLILGGGELKEGWFDLRVLSASLLLELALHLNHPDLNPAVYEQAIREVFTKAEQVKPASVKGLASLVGHWHVVAAAYLAFCPEPLACFSFASRLMLRLGHNNAVFELQLPQSFAAELVLRSLDVDHRLGISFVAADLGSSRKKKLDLFGQQGEVLLWRETVSAVSLIYGFKKQKQAAYDKQAERLYRSFSVKPIVKSSYRYLPMLECIDHYTQALLRNDMTAEQYSSRLLDL